MIARTFLDGGGPHERSRRHEVLALRRPAAGRRLGGSLPTLPPVRRSGRLERGSLGLPVLARGAHHELSLDSLIADIGATGQQPADADAHYSRGITLAVQGMLEEAIAEFRAEGTKGDIAL